MTGKNNEDLLNIYDDKDSDGLFDIDKDTELENKDLDESPLKLEDVNSNSNDLDFSEFDEIDDISIENTKDDTNKTPLESNEKVENIVENIDEDEIDEWFMDEINELKNEWEKKSLFLNIFKRNKKEDLVDENKLNESSLDEIEDETEKWEKKSIFGNLFKKKALIEDKDSNHEEIVEKEKSSNIFDDFNQDESLLEEVDQLKQERERDVYFYINKAGSTLQLTFVLLLLLLSILHWYIYVQNMVFADEEKDNQLLWPFCFVLLNWIDYDLDFCTSVATLNQDYSNKLKSTKEDQITKLLSVIKTVYEIENFTKTKDVTFLKDKTDNKLKVLEIIKEFDDIKNEFAKVDKQTIQCKTLEIDQLSKVLSMTCDAYSAWYESWIRWFDWKNDPNSLLKWTSLSIANSFLNYITLESKVFTIIDRQKLFKLENIVWSKTWFTNKTSFNLKLKYNLD